MEQKKTYLIYNYRAFSSILFSLTSFLLPLLILFFSGWGTTLTIIIFGLLFISGFFVAKLGLQPIRIILSNEKIRFEYLSYNLDRIIKIKEALLKNISEFSDHSSGLDQRLTLFFINHMTLQFHKQHYFNRKDDFEQLLYDLKLLSSQKNNLGEPSIQKFPKYWDYYKSKDAKFWFYVSLISIPVLLTISVLTKEFRLLIFLAFPIGYIIKFHINNKK